MLLYILGLCRLLAIALSSVWTHHAENRNSGQEQLLVLECTVGMRTCLGSCSLTENHMCAALPAGTQRALYC